MYTPPEMYVHAITALLTIQTTPTNLVSR